MDNKLILAPFDKTKIIYLEYAYIKDTDTLFFAFEKADEINKKIENEEAEFRSITLPVLVSKKNNKILSIYINEFSRIGNVIDVNTDNGQDYSQKVVTK
jgi:hypothetical protein